MAYFLDKLFFGVVVFSHVLTFTTVATNKIKCIKKDACSCETVTNPKLHISLWQIQPGVGMVDPDMPVYYSVDLCHGVSKSVKTNGTSCVNTSVCVYDANQARGIGSYKSGIFGDYDNDTKSMSIQYQVNTNAPRSALTRPPTSITVTLVCVPNGNISKANYMDFRHDTLDEYKGTIKSKAACLVGVVTPLPTQPGTAQLQNSKGLSTVYIVVIALGIFAFILLCGFVVLSVIAKRRNNGALLDDIQPHDYGTSTDNEKPSPYYENALTRPI